jgi:ribosomal protein L7/L12
MKSSTKISPKKLEKVIERVAKRLLPGEHISYVGKCSNLRPQLEHFVVTDSRIIGLDVVDEKFSYPINHITHFEFDAKKGRVGISVSDGTEVTIKGIPIADMPDVESELLALQTSGGASLVSSSGDSLGPTTFKQQKALARIDKDAEKQAKKQQLIELYGKMLIDDVFAGSSVRIYEKGYVRISKVGVFTSGHPFEKLRLVSSSTDVAKKTGVGRAIVAVPTFGVNLLTENRRGDIYLTIATDRKTHVLHKETPTLEQIKKMHKLAGAVQGVLDMAERHGTEERPTIYQAPSSSLATPSSLLDELKKLVELRDAGGLTEDEFLSLKKSLMATPGSSESIQTDEPASASTITSPTTPGRQLFDVELLDAKADLIGTIKVVRSFTNLKLGEAKKLVDSAPVVVVRSLTHETATQFVSELRAVGATAEVR